MKNVAKPKEQSSLLSEYILNETKGLVSVVVPVYNVRDYLSDCIESICSQSYGDLEIILVDDGSTDDSGIICDQAAELNKNIRVVHKENGGLSSARNAGIDIANGEFIVFVDSDDVIGNDYVEKLIEPFHSNESADISICGFARFSENINEVKLLSDCVFQGYRRISNLEALAGICNTDHSTYFEITCNKMYRVELFDGIRFPVGKVHEDVSTVYKLLYKAKDIYICDEALYYYRLRQDSITGAFRRENLDLIEALEQRDAFYHSLLPASIANAHTVFALNAIMRLFYRSDGSAYDEAILNSYRELYQSSIGEIGRGDRMRLAVQRYLPTFCRIAYKVKERIA